MYQLDAQFKNVYQDKSCLWIFEFLIVKFEFRGSLSMSLERELYEFKVTPNLELLVTFGKSLS
jgi:hypothetical protein